MTPKPQYSCVGCIGTIAVVVTVLIALHLHVMLALIIALAVGAVVFFALNGPAWKGLIYANVHAYSTFRSRGVDHWEALERTAISRFPVNRNAAYLILANLEGWGEEMGDVGDNRTRAVVNSHLSELEGTAHKQLALYLWMVFFAEIGFPPGGRGRVLEAVGSAINRAIRKAGF